jgi:hypothetical protein
MAEERTDESDNTDDDTGFVWEQIDETDGSAEEDGTINLEELIPEEPRDADPESGNSEQMEGECLNPPPSDMDREVSDAGTEETRKRGTDAQGVQRTDTDEKSTTPAGEGKQPDRLWNRFGSEDETDSAAPEPSETGKSEPQEANGTAGGEKKETEKRMDGSEMTLGKTVNGESTRGPDPEHESARNTDTGSPDSDRLWNRTDTDSGKTGPDRTAETGNDAANRDTAADNTVTGDPMTVGDAATEDTTTDGDTATGETDGSSSPGTSFDHLLERSRGKGGNARPVGSPSVETDLDTFFSDLEEFDRATSGSQVLIISPRDHSISDEVCSKFLTAGGVSGRNAMFVTAVESPSERIEICETNEDWTGGEVAVIEVGETGSDDESFGQFGGTGVIHKRVNSPKNLSKTGLLITQTLKKWSGSNQPAVLCFHTLTAISSYVENETLFQFLFTLQAKLNSLGVTGHYHMDANRHSQQEMSMLKTLFDLVVSISRNGEIELE